jgi:hypothetical protein
MAERPQHAGEADCSLALSEIWNMTPHPDPTPNEHTKRHAEPAVALPIEVDLAVVELKTRKSERPKCGHAGSR